MVVWYKKCHNAGKTNIRCKNVLPPPEMFPPDAAQPLLLLLLLWLLLLLSLLVEAEVTPVTVALLHVSTSSSSSSSWTPLELPSVPLDSVPSSPMSNMLAVMFSMRLPSTSASSSSCTHTLLPPASLYCCMCKCHRTSKSPTVAINELCVSGMRSHRALAYFNMSEALLEWRAKRNWYLSTI